MKRALALALVSVLCLSIPQVLIQRTNAANDVKVLHVSSNLNNELQRVIDSVSMTSLFSVTQVSVQDFNSGNPIDLTQYSSIVFGINDGGESRGAYSGVYGRLTELISYVEGGGGIAWTHDTLEYVTDYGTSVETPAGVDFTDGGPTIGGTTQMIKIVDDHPVLHAPFEIGDVGDLIPKTIGPFGQYDGTTGGTVTTATIVIEHDEASQLANFYLAVNEYGAGRVVVTELGHSMGDYGLGLESTRENQILVNAIYWASSPSPVVITNVRRSKTIVGEGYSCKLNVTVMNTGDQIETTNVTLWAKNDAFPTMNIQTLTGIDLVPYEGRQVTFSWNTSDWVYGNYTVGAMVSWGEAVPYEYQDSWVFITIPGDVDGDRVVSILDTVTITSRYAEILQSIWPPLTPQTDVNCDINGDEVISILDVVICTGHYAQKWS